MQNCLLKMVSCCVANGCSNTSSETISPFKSYLTVAATMTKKGESADLHCTDFLLCIEIGLVCDVVQHVIIKKEGKAVLWSLA